MTTAPTPDAADLVVVDVRERIATLTLNRPQARNALNLALRRAIRDTVGAVDARDDVEVIILTGAGSAFCAGLDLHELSRDDDGGAPTLVAGPSEMRFFAETEKPVIAAVNGPAVTGGLELVLQCDLIVASERATFGDTHARVGVLPGGGLTVRLPEAIGYRAALAMSLSGNFLTAERAYQLGLAYAVVPPDALLDAAQSLARDITGADPSTMRRLLAVYREGAMHTGAQGLQLEAEAFSGWLSTFTPGAVAERKSGIIARGRSQQ